MKKDLLIPIIGVVVVAAICYGLSTTTPQVAPTPTRPFSATTGPSPTTSDVVVMRVNGEPVTEKEFALFLTSLPEQMQPMLGTAAGRKEAAQQLAKMKALEQEGRRLGADEDPEVAARMKFGHVNVAADYALRKLAGKPDEAALRAEFAKERSKFEMLDLSHILLAVQGGQAPPRSGGKPNSVQETMQNAARVEAALQQGADFAGMARAVSDDTGTAQQGGALGPIPVGQLPPDVVAAVSKLQPGQITQPVQTQFGVHIFKLNGRRVPTFDDVKPQLQARAQQNTIKAAVDALQKKARVELDPKFFTSESEKPAPVPAPAPRQ